MKESTITIFDHNIWGGMPKDDRIANRNHLIAGLIDYHDADVIAFQECSPKTSRAEENDIAELLEPTYAEVECGMGKDNHTPIFYKKERFSVISSGYFAYERLNNGKSKSITYAILEDKESFVRFGFISTHFWWKSDGKEDDEVRMYNAETLSNYINTLKEKYDVPVFAMGDLNCGINSTQDRAPYYHLKERFLDTRDIAPISTDLLSHHDLPKMNKDGIYTAEGRAEPERNLDYIFVTEHRNVAIDSFEVDSSDDAYASSDHFPLVVKARVFG